jgi:hypothetical protein
MTLRYQLLRRNRQGEMAGAVLWRRSAIHSGEISANDNEILYFLIFKTSRLPLQSAFSPSISDAGMDTLF